MIEAASWWILSIVIVIYNRSGLVRTLRSIPFGTAVPWLRSMVGCNDHALAKLLSTR
jgi:hypothetical protein